VGVTKTGTGACDAGGAAAGATIAAAGALAPILAAVGRFLAGVLLFALTGVQTLTFFLRPWTFLVTTLQVFLTLAAAFLCGLAFGLVILAAPTISPVVGGPHGALDDGMSEQPNV
jgi:hypothetical protein